MNSVYPPFALRPEDAAKYIGVSRRYLTKLASMGLVPVSHPTHGVSMYIRTDLEAFVKKHRRQGIGERRAA